jgi:hypothetical protein
MSSVKPKELPYEDQIADLTSRLEAAKENVAELEAQLDWWRKGRDLYGASNSKGAEQKPTLAKAILRVMDEGDQTEWPTAAIIEALKSRGWMPNGTSAVHAVRARLAKLARGDDPVLQRVGHGVYALTGDP